MSTTNLHPTIAAAIAPHIFAARCPRDRVKVIADCLPTLCAKHFDNAAENAEYHGLLGRIEFELKRLKDELPDEDERCEKCGEFCAPVLLNDDGNCPDCAEPEIVGGAS